MDNSIKKIIAKLGKKLQQLKQPIQILAICSGGKVVGQNLHSYLLEKNIQSNYFEIWTNMVNGKSSIWKTDFPTKDYEGNLFSKSSFFHLPYWSISQNNLTECSFLKDTNGDFAQQLFLQNKLLISGLVVSDAVISSLI